jgi:hypothetical protein
LRVTCPDIQKELLSSLLASEEALSCGGGRGGACAARLRFFEGFGEGETSLSVPFESAKKTKNYLSSNDEA